jgi:hypothetical protein
VFGRYVTRASFEEPPIMTDTPNLARPFIESGQAQKHVIDNEALRILDAAIQIAVLDRCMGPRLSWQSSERCRHVCMFGSHNSPQRRVQDMRLRPRRRCEGGLTARSAFDL